MSGQMASNAETAKRLAENGATRRQIAETLGITLPYVSYLSRVAKFKIESDCKAKRFAADVARLAQSGKTMDAIAIELSISRKTVHNIARKNGIKFLGRRYRKHSDRSRQMFDLYAEGKTFREIGETFGVSRQAAQQGITGYAKYVALHLARCSSQVEEG